LILLAEPPAPSGYDPPTLGRVQDAVLVVPAFPYSHLAGAYLELAGEPEDDGDFEIEVGLAFAPPGQDDPQFSDQGVVYSTTLPVSAAEPGFWMHRRYGLMFEVDLVLYGEADVLFSVYVNGEQGLDTSLAIYEVPGAPPLSGE
jgi:hypothetical protein